MKILDAFPPVVVTALLLAACGAHPVQMSDQDHGRLMAINDNLIVPGVRVGPVFLGMTEADLFKKLGSPTSTSNHLQKDIAYVYDAQGLMVAVSLKTHVVDLISVTSVAHSTSGGLTLGSSPLQMKAELGNWNGPIDYLHQANYDGITLQFNPQGNVGGLYITFFEATGQSIHY